eukprot:1157404-Pelagomonas_calceolata.AAC.1
MSVSSFTLMTNKSGQLSPPHTLRYSNDVGAPLVGQHPLVLLFMLAPHPCVRQNQDIKITL